MCKYPQFEIKNLKLINKLSANVILTDMQLAFSKAGGSITKSDLEGMTLQHFICLCAMNRVQVKLR